MDTSLRRTLWSVPRGVRLKRLYCTMMKTINVAMLLSVTLISGKECNDFKLTKAGKKLERNNDNLQYSCKYQILPVFG